MASHSASYGSRATIGLLVLGLIALLALSLAHAAAVPTALFMGTGVNTSCIKNSDDYVVAPCTFFGASNLTAPNTTYVDACYSALFMGHSLPNGASMSVTMSTTNATEVADSLLAVLSERFAVINRLWLTPHIVGASNIPNTTANAHAFKTFLDAIGKKLEPSNTDPSTVKFGIVGSTSSLLSMFAGQNLTEVCEECHLAWIAPSASSALLPPSTIDDYVPILGIPKSSVGVLLNQADNCDGASLRGLALKVSTDTFYIGKLNLKLAKTIVIWLVVALVLMICCCVTTPISIIGCIACGIAYSIKSSSSSNVQHLTTSYREVNSD